MSPLTFSLDSHSISFILTFGLTHRGCTFTLYFFNTSQDWLILQISLASLRVPHMASHWRMTINVAKFNNSLSLNGVNTILDMNIIPLVYYDILIGMDWLDQYHFVLDCHNNTFTYLDEEGKQRTMKGIPRPISIREMLALQLKKCFRK
jgi:hypothetical protein